ncbi:MAG: hypothetical protein P4L83_21410 [Nevskia sp.]|nr:hypothetical protein [Nevskia sp.]
MKRFHKNVPGDFYTTGDCMACTLPEGEAPELLAPLEGDNSDTYFIRQPRTPEEIEHACSAAEVCCVNAIRYGGHDQWIIRRLGNQSDYCDHLLPQGPVGLEWETDERWRQAVKAQKPWWKFW